MDFLLCQLGGGVTARNVGRRRIVDGNRAHVGSWLDSESARGSYVSDWKKFGRGRGSGDERITAGKMNSGYESLRGPVDLLAIAGWIIARLGWMSR
jgi:hypothetical protein